MKKTGIYKYNYLSFTDFIQKKIFNRYELSIVNTKLNIFCLHVCPTDTLRCIQMNTGYELDYM